MSWFLHNAVADLYGPYFLLFYPMAIGAVILACFKSVRSVDRTRAMEPPEIPAKVDPYEVAYLRGGENEVARVAVLSLIQRGLLQITESRDWSSTAVAILKEVDRGRDPAPGELSLIEASIIKWSGFPATGEQIFGPDGIPGLVKETCDHYQDNLADKELLVPPGMTQLGTWLWWFGSALILGLGGCILAVALANGPSNAGLFIFIMAIMGVAGVVALAPACFSFPRTSHRGKAYLDQLELAYDRLKSKSRPAGSTLTMAGDPGAREPMRERAVHFDRLLTNGIFGTVSPADTPLTELVATLIRIGFFRNPEESPPMG